MSVNVFRPSRGRLQWLSGFIAIMVAVAVSGCGGAGDVKATVKVTGKVMHGGNPVTGGSLLFSPVAEGKNKEPGKPARGTLKSDGTYVLTTYKDGDGAVVGKHRVSYLPPAPEVDAHGEPKGEAKFVGLIPSNETVDVPKGDGSIDIELAVGPTQGN